MALLYVIKKASPPDWLGSLISIIPLVVEPGELLGTSIVNLSIVLKVPNEPVDVAEPLIFAFVPCATMSPLLPSPVTKILPE